MDYLESFVSECTASPKSELYTWLMLLELRKTIRKQIKMISEISIFAPPPPSELFYKSDVMNSYRVPKSNNSSERQERGTSSGLLLRAVVYSLPA